MSVALQLARSPAASPNGAGGNYPVRGCSANSGDFLHCWVACLDITRRGQPARGISCTTRANAHEEVSAWGVDAAWGHPASRLTYSKAHEAFRCDCRLHGCDNAVTDDVWSGCSGQGVISPEHKTGGAHDQNVHVTTDPHTRQSDGQGAPRRGALSWFLSVSACAETSRCVNRRGCS